MLQEVWDSIACRGGPRDFCHEFPALAFKKLAAAQLPSAMSKILVVYF
jgi:hypothetical protein